MAQVLNTDTKDNNSFGFNGKTQRGQVSTDFVEAFSCDTTQRPFLVIDSASIGGVNCVLTVFNRAASAASVRIRLYVSNDNGRLASNAGRVTVSSVYDETESSVSLPKTIAANAAFHFSFNYKNQAILTTFRFWHWVADCAANTASIDAFICAK